MALQHPELMSEPAWGTLSEYLKGGA